MQHLRVILNYNVLERLRLEFGVPLRASGATPFATSSFAPPHATQIRIVATDFDVVWRERGTKFACRLFRGGLVDPLRRPSCAAAR